MADVTITSVPTGATLATAIAYLNSNIAALRTGLVGNVEGRGAGVPNMASRTVDETTVAHNASVCTFDAEGGAAGYLVTGFTYSSASGFTATYTSGTAYIIQTSTDPDQKRRIVVSSNVTVLLTASSDNYVYLKTDGTLGSAVTTVGGPAPTLPADTLLLSIATTDGSTVTGTPVDKRVTSAAVVSKHWRSRGFVPVPTSTSNLRLPPGTCELEGVLFETTSNTDVDVTASGNYASGTRTSAAFCYMIAANNGGSLKISLTMSAPSATTITGGATAGTAGKLQFRTIGAVRYRYIGAHLLGTGGTLRQGTRVFPYGDFIYASSPTLRTANPTVSFDSVACATWVPPVCRTAKIIFQIATGASGGGVGFRENGSGFALGQTMSAPGTSVSFGAVMDVPISSARKFDVRAGKGTEASGTIMLNGYREDFD